MTTSNLDLAAQEEQLNQIKLEMARLDDAFAKHMKELGLTEEELKQIKPGSLPPEAGKLLAEAREAAKRAGEDRVAAAKNPAARPQAAPSRRGGSLIV